MSDELKKKIEGMMNYAELNFSDWASVKEDEIVSLRQALSEIQTPLDVLNRKRYTLVGEMLFSGAREALNEYGVPRKTLPTMRLDTKRLYDFLSLLRSMGLLHRALMTDSLIYNDDEKKEFVHSMFEDGEICNMQLDHLAGVMQQWTEDAISNVGLHTSSNLRAELIHNNDEAIGQKVCDGIRDAWDNEEMTVVYNSLVSALFTWSRDPEERSASQKGKGIQLLSESSVNSNLYYTAPSMFLTLETAKTASTAELLATLDMVPLPSSAQSCLRDVLRHGNDLYIRTCPASPRPGVLPNIKAGTVKEFVDGVRYLANAMSDPDHPDYDPQGELCVMKYMDSDLSGVLVKGHNSMVVGLGSSGVTAGEGSTLIIPLSDTLSDSLTYSFNNIMSKAPDGFDNHEIEMVWPATDMGGNYGYGVDVEDIIETAGYMEANRRPVITQIRGLGKQKPELKAPATYTDQDTGELVTMTTRGNVPHGVVSQTHYEDVGKGDLSDCAKLEADIKNGVIVEGQKDFVIYCPSGSTNCHAAGVANDHSLAIVYAPVHEDVTWTEVDGWVTTATGVEPAPYDPAPFTSYFFDGCRDGDRYWDYGYHSLSQFFHTYISSPYNDPRFEAYLAGFYSTWIIKATLAVALGETRHGYSSQAKFTMKAGLLPILLLKASNKMHKFPSGPVGRRTNFYEVLKNTEMGLDGMFTALDALRGCYADDIYWSSSYGGKKYLESVDKAIDAVNALIDLQNGGKLSKVLGTINTLENAVHNCSYFFDKFVSSKTYFDIGTSNHTSLGTIPQQYMTVVSMHKYFYTHVVDEQHKISEDAHKEYTFGVQDILLGSFNTHVMSTVKKLTSLPSDSNGIEILRGDYGSRAIKHVEEVMEYMQPNDDTCYVHKVGTCVLPHCMKRDCAENRATNEYGIEMHLLHHLQSIIGSNVVQLASSVSSSHDTIYAYHKSKLTPVNQHDPVGTVFTASTRDAKNNAEPVYSNDSVTFPSFKGMPGLPVEVPVLEIVRDYTVEGTDYKEGDLIINPDVLAVALYSKVVDVLPFDQVTDSLIRDILRFIQGSGSNPIKDLSNAMNDVFVYMHEQFQHIYHGAYTEVHNLGVGFCDSVDADSVGKYMLTLWLSEYVVRNDGWSVGRIGGSWIGKSEYHAKGYQYPNTVFAGHSANQLLQVLMSIIDIDNLKQIMEETQ